METFWPTFVALDETMGRRVGVVSDRLWPLVPLRSGSAAFWALVDTGFEGYLMIPNSARSQLGVTRTSRFASSKNADGTESIVPIGRLRFEWLGHPVTIEVHVPAEDVLADVSHAGQPVLGVVGLYLLQGLRLSFDLYPGRDVIIVSA